MVRRVLFDIVAHVALFNFFFLGSLHLHVTCF